MPKAIETAAQRFDFEPEEFILGITFNNPELLRDVLRNELALIIEERTLVKVNVDSNNPNVEYLLTQEYLRGRYESFKWLLVMKETSQQDLIKLYEARKTSQKNDVNLNGNGE